MRARAVAPVAVALAVAAGCTGGSDSERRAEVARRVAEAEGGAEGGAPGAAEGQPSRVPLTITRHTGSPPPPAPVPPTPAVSAWASAIARDIDTLDRRSRQQLSVSLLRRDRDPAQKSQELIASMQWCDDGSLEACLHVGHVLLFNECLFERARGFYEKAASLADTLPAEAVDHFTVDGTIQRQELRQGLRYSDPAQRDDQQIRAVAAVCGAVAERDRPLWDAMFDRYASGGLTPAATPSTGEERLGLGVTRRKMIIALEERIAAIERLHAGTGQDLRKRLATTADELCAAGDAQSCATASFLHSLACRLPQMEDAYRRYQSELDGLDAASRAQAEAAAREVIGLARAYVDGDAPARDLALRAMCAARR